MGPLVSPWTAERPSWLAVAIVVLPCCTAVALLFAHTDAPARHVVDVRGDSDAELARLRELARAEYKWVADHGKGCARSTEHLLPYTRLASTTDQWGGDIGLTCLHYQTDGHEVMSWRVRSFGPDRVGDTADDLVAYEYWDLGPVRDP